jgi:hypothetical protein
MNTLFNPLKKAFSNGPHISYTRTVTCIPARDLTSTLRTNEAGSSETSVSVHQTTRLHITQNLTVM